MNFSSRLQTWHKREGDSLYSGMADLSNMVMCSCGSSTQLSISWTDRNPERRFHCCTKKGRSCGFVAWAGPPMCQRSLQVIPGLLKRCNNYEAIVLQSVKERKKMKFLLGISWVFFIISTINMVMNGLTKILQVVNRASQMQPLL
ncbi:hypothetical protein R6Q57_016801 [Mikania cordata]